ncbi:hypothetical protein A0H81_03088 [Grifola frondosa]|uniref:Uncharacterized protein n=1 Tax=Grifola frondosa TaxID=5627 RepID=A0A1C7MGS4_GRIFR|nr:hypothetical protein A0H81_03088 [Grifola frondosa]
MSHHPRQRTFTRVWERDPNGPALKNPPPKGMRTPNNLIWGHSLTDLIRVSGGPSVPSVDSPTIWSRSMIKELGENYPESELDAPEPRPRVLRPWSALTLPREFLEKRSVDQPRVVSDNASATVSPADVSQADMTATLTSGTGVVEAESLVCEADECLPVSHPSAECSGSGIVSSVGVSEVNKAAASECSVAPVLSESLVDVDISAKDVPPSPKPAEPSIRESAPSNASAWSAIRTSSCDDASEASSCDDSETETCTESSSAPGTSTCEDSDRKLDYEDASNEMRVMADHDHDADGLSDELRDLFNISLDVFSSPKQLSSELDYEDASSEIGIMADDDDDADSLPDALRDLLNISPAVFSSPRPKSLFSVEGLPELRQFIPKRFFPDYLMVYDPNEITYPHGSRGPIEHERQPIKYKRVLPKFPAIANDPPLEGTLHLSRSNQLGSGHHSNVYRAPHAPGPTSRALADRASDRRSEGRTSFPRHLMEDWSGHNYVPPGRYPVPVGAVVPKFFGYYRPVCADGSVARRFHPDCDDDSKCYVTWASPILLVEECGEPVEPSSFTLDQRSECFSLIFRLHEANFVQNSCYPATSSSSRVRSRSRLRSARKARRASASSILGAESRSRRR